MAHGGPGWLSLEGGSGETCAGHGLCSCFPRSRAADETYSGSPAGSGTRSAWLSRPAVLPRSEALGKLPASLPSSLSREAPRGRCGRHLRRSSVMMPADSVTAHRDLGLAPGAVPGSQHGSALRAWVSCRYPARQARGAGKQTPPSVPEAPPVTAGVGGPTPPAPRQVGPACGPGSTRAPRDSHEMEPVPAVWPVAEGPAFPCPPAVSLRLLNLLSTLASGSAPEQLRLSFLALGTWTITNWRQEQRP